MSDYQESVGFSETNKFIKIQKNSYNTFMSAHFVNIERETPMLFSIDLKERLSENSFFYRRRRGATLCPGLCH